MNRLISATVIASTCLAGQALAAESDKRGLPQNVLIQEMVVTPKRQEF